MATISILPHDRGKVICVRIDCTILISDCHGPFVTRLISLSSGTMESATLVAANSSMTVV